MEISEKPLDVKMFLDLVKRALRNGEHFRIFERDDVTFSVAYKCNHCEVIFYLKLESDEEENRYDKLVEAFRKRFGRKYELVISKDTNYRATLLFNKKMVLDLNYQFPEGQQWIKTQIKK